MEQERANWKNQIGIMWIKSDSGNTYFCQRGAISHLDSPTEEDLRELCVEESLNPQND